MFFIKHLVFVLSVLSFVHSTPSCGENEVYTNCMSPCKLQHCKHLKQSPDCDPKTVCLPGCECIQHFLRNSDNVCISSEICEEYDSQFDPEKDIDIILNEGDDDEATNEDQDFYDTVTSKDGLPKEIESDSKMRPNTEDVENKDHDTEDDDIDEIEYYQSFNDELKNGDWVVEHNDTNQEPNTDQKLLPEEEIKTVDNNENVEQSKQNYVINAPLPTLSSDQQKLSDEKSGLDKEGSTERQNVQAPENKVEPTTEMKLKPEEIESNRTETNQVNIDDKFGNTEFDQNVDETLETSTLPEKNELPIRRPITEIYPEDKKDTNQWREPHRPRHDKLPNKTRPEQNTDQTQKSTNIPENNGWPNKRPETEVNPEDKKDTNQWREPHRPRHDKLPNKTRPEENTDQTQESTNIPDNNGWPNKRHETEEYHKDKKDTKQWREPHRPRHDKLPNKTRPEENTDQTQESTNIPDNNGWPNKRHETEEYPKDKKDTKQCREPPYTTSRPEYTTKRWHPYPPPQKWHGRYRHKRPRSRVNQITVIYPIPIPYPDHGRENEYDRNHEPDHTRENEYDRNHEPDHTRENEYDRNHEPNRGSENRYDRDRESKRRRGNEYGHDRSSHRRSRTWCRRYPGDKRRPCPWYKTKPWYRPKHDSHPDYKNKKHNSHHDRTYRRPKRVCRRQRNGKTVCYVPKSYKRTSRRN